MIAGSQRMLSLKSDKISASTDGRGRPNNSVPGRAQVEKKIAGSLKQPKTQTLASICNSMSIMRSTYAAPKGGKWVPIIKWIPVFRAIGAFVLILSSLIFIPIFGIIGAAYSVVIAFFSMSLAIYTKLQFIYPISYNWVPILIPVFFLFIAYLGVKSITFKIFLTIIFPTIWYLFALEIKEQKALRKQFNSLIKL